MPLDRALVYHSDLEVTVPSAAKRPHVIGTGAFGIVVSVEVGSRKVAVKRVSIKTGYDARSVYREIFLLSNLRHHNVLTLHDVYTVEDERACYLVSKLGQLSLYKLIKDHFALFTPEKIVMILYQLLCGINYFHSAGVWHRDLKPGNVFLTTHPLYLQIGDFGTSRSEPSQGAWTTSYVQTRPYRAPEMILWNYGASCDIWSLGCILAEMLLGRVYLEGTSEHVQFTLICKATGLPSLEVIDDLLAASPMRQAQKDDVRAAITMERELVDDVEPPPRLDSFAEELLVFLRSMLRFDPKARVTSAEALRNPIFDTVRGNYETTYEGPPLALPSDSDTDWIEAVHAFARDFVPRDILYAAHDDAAQEPVAS